MSQAGYTPIQLYYSTTAAAVPVNTNLANGELAINITDGKLYYKDNGGTVRLLASNATSAPVLSFQTSLSGLTPSTATTGVVTLAGTLGAASGGTGLTTLATGSLTYGAGTSAFSTLAIGTAGQVLTVNSGATAPQWSTLSGVAVTTFSAGTTGFTPSSATAGAVTLAGTLATTNGGTNLTSFTSGGVVYASSTSALATGSALNFDGTSLNIIATSGSDATVSTLSNNGGLRQQFNPNFSTGTKYFWRIDVNGLSDQSWSLIPSTTVGGSTFSTAVYRANGNGNQTWSVGSTRMMDLTSTGLGIGTSSPDAKLTIYGNGAVLTMQTSRNFTVNRNWQIGTDQFIEGQFTITPSTTLGGTTYTTPAIRIDQVGNLGLGVTPQAWATNGKAFQVGNSAGFFSSSSLEATVTNNAYLNAGASAWVYINTAQASRYQQYQGVHSWFNAASGTAGNAITFTQAMTLDASGNLGVGTTSPNIGVWNKAITLNTATGNAAYEVAVGGTAKGFFAADASNLYIQAFGAIPMLFNTNGSERVRIDSAGTFIIKNDYQETTYTANSSTAITLNIVTNGTDQVITLTGNATITMPTATAGKSFLLKLKTGAGGYTVTWSTVKWPSGTAPTLTSTASRMDIFSFFADGTNWYGCTVGQNYTP